MAAEPGSPDALADRYGRTGRSRHRRIGLAIAAGAAAIGVAVAWVVWVGVLGPDASLEVLDSGHAIAADGSVDVRFEITTDPGTAVSCAVQALDKQFAIVGWKIVDIPPSEQRRRAFVENVRTVQTPTTGLIYRCWLT